MSAARERAVSHSLSCTALEWECIRALAADAGKPMSRYLVDRLLGRDGEGDAEADHAPVLDLASQRAMHDAVGRAEATVARLVSAPDDASPDVPEAVRALFEARLEDMVRAGRHAAARALLVPIVGGERAARALGRAVERVARHG